MTAGPNLRNSDARIAALAQSAIVATSFAGLLAGSNAVNPLLPVYRDKLGLAPFVLSLTFVIYVAALSLLLFVLARPRFSRIAPQLLLISLAVEIASDLLLADPHEWSILLGRALAGAACGLGTGAASALVVAGVGTAGRAVTATGNFAGAVLGVGASQAAEATLAPAAPYAVFLGHAIITAVLFTASATVLRMRYEANRKVFAACLGAERPSRIDLNGVRMLVTGAIGWIGVSMAVVFGATVFSELKQPLVQAVGPILLLSTSALTQLASPVIHRCAPWASGVLTMTFGVSGILAGAGLRADYIAIAGFALLGAGVGVSYRASLVALTRGAAPARQGELSSLYAATSYTAAASVVLLVGWIGNFTGLVPAMILALVIFAGLALVTFGWAPRLRDTVDIL